ncbi:hypothetical protein BU26DRAFT_389173, partial [Trematosphaeria pertusa]
PLTSNVCNSMFSRPYDLTRHERSVHDPCKEPIRSVLCFKNFSRNDALSRHM